MYKILAVICLLAGGNLSGGEKFKRELYPIELPREEGDLQVSDKHTIHYALYGNPDGIPVIASHGGPGAGYFNAMTTAFDLEKWNVIMWDQRGAMRSTPFGVVEDNTPQNSISDMEKLREHLGVDTWVVFGGSWGSSLSMLYGEAHPDRCRAFILRGVWLCREQDYKHLFYGMGKVFPEAYDELLKHIPEEEHDDLITACYKRVMDSDPAVHLPTARIFMEYDSICATHLPNPEFVKVVNADDRVPVAVTRFFCHYAMNHFFLEDNQILDNMHEVEHIPAIIVHGRWDAICLPENAYLVHKHWSNSQLWMVPDGGHASGDPSIAAGLASATDYFVEELSN